MELHQEELDLGLDLIIQDSLDLKIVGHLMQTLVLMVVGKHLVSAVDHTLLNRDSFLQPLEVLVNLLLEYYLEVITLQVRGLLVRILEGFLMVLEVEDHQKITKVFLGDLQEALDHQNKVEEVLAIVLMEVQVEAQDLVKIASREEWEE